MSETTDSVPAKKLHNPLHVTIAVTIVTTVCAVMLHSQGTPPKYVFGLLLAVTLGMLALEKINNETCFFEVRIRGPFCKL